MWNLIAAGSLIALVLLALNRRRIWAWANGDPSQPERPKGDDGLKINYGDDGIRPVAEEEEKGVVSEEHMKEEMAKVSKQHRIKTMVENNRPLKGEAPAEEYCDASTAYGHILQRVTERKSEAFAVEDGEIKFSEADRQHLKNIFRGTVLDAYLNYGIGVNKKGQMIVPLEAIDYVTKNYDPVIMPGGTIRVTNLLTLDKNIALSLEAQTPIYYNIEGSTRIKMLTHEQVQMIVASRNDMESIKKTETMNAELRNKGEQVFALQKKESEYIREIERLEKELRERDAANDKLQQAQKTLEQQLETEKRSTERLALQLETLERVFTSSPSSGTVPPVSVMTDPEPAPAKVEPVREPVVPVPIASDEVPTKPSKAPEKKSAPSQPSGTEKLSPQQKANPSPRNQPTPDDAGSVASPRQILDWLTKAATEDNVENYKRFGLIGTKMKRTVQYGVFDLDRLYPFVAAEAAKRGVGVNPKEQWGGRLGYIPGDDGKVYSVTTVEQQYKSGPLKAYVLPRAIGFYKDKSSAGNLDTDEDLKARYNALIKQVDGGEAIALSPGSLGMILRKEVWK